jgi:LacI family transcriptional regulator
MFNADRFDSPGRIETCEMLTKLCDGLVVVMPTAQDSFLHTLEQQKLNSVLVCFDAKQLGMPTVVPENRIGARIAVEHLIALGHRRIAFIAGNPGTGQSGEREQGYLDGLQGAGLAPDPALMLNGAFAQAGGFSATEALLALDQPPTAIFAANDEMAFGAMDAINSKGLKVPDDVSVVGFDDIPTASYVFPTLTTMRQPFRAMARRAVSEVVELIQGREPGAVKIAFPVELVVRKSTGPVPA